MKPTVFITRPIPTEVEAYIAEHCTYRIWEGGGSISRSRLLEELADVEGLLTVGGRIDEELLQHAPRLKVVSNISVGYNNFDIEAMKAHNVIGTHTPSVLDETVADLTFALMLAAARRVPELDRYVKEGKWESGDDEPFFGIDVHGTTLGIIGMGRIGEAIARRAAFGFNMDVLYYNRTPKPEAEKRLDARYCPLEELLRKSDFVVLMVPLTAESMHMMGREQFAMMKRSAIFINVSRGKTVDESALIEALAQKKIWAAGLDVFDEEPVSPDNPLLRMANVVTLPHIGSATHKTRFEMAMLAAENLVAALSGKTPPNVVNELKEVKK
ncbi:2-hydroxyacid dehydrogenase [Aneurinibacillus danicus]|uniref:Bifunctional glyoxylate/hydroxypyruvate reductase B n=1 Tax=Aneurinibacillus danicus TaxID=267746 RepID=A0A511V5Y6_9BACL|nr:D-glycerate dehydrogenase [Aneurinibacillus danicus]GEN34356.1 bifunctional glyoxylate/hydroxypyruvate reductase B [Aneurinibacillus danicus]